MTADIGVRACPEVRGRHYPVLSIPASNAKHLRLRIRGKSPWARDWQEQGRGDIPKHWAIARTCSTGLNDGAGLQIKDQGRIPHPEIKSTHGQVKKLSSLSSSLERRIERVNPGVVWPDVYITLRPFLIRKVTQWWILNIRILLRNLKGIQASRTL